MVLESFFSVADLSSNSAEAIETLGLLLGVYKMWVERPASNGESNDEESYTEEEALADLFLGQEELRTAMALLKRKKNIVLQGAPGVGKTFIAKRLAYLLNGTTAATRIETVQFHQSYSYEDFIQGYRPRSDGGFERRDGVFHRFCEKAKLDDRPHVLIVDEINRGNLSKILGELMMLIEPDKRGPSSALRLLYSQGADESFFVPENVYIIGTMNTADRSLALVDYALRRRFVFVDIRPAFGTARFKEHIIKGGLSEDIAQLIIARMVQLNKEIAEDTSNLGPGYEIGHSYFCSARPTEESEQEWFRRIVRFEIEPLLREYWFDAPDKVTSAVSELLA
jgi:5-methylcytosine-specific restriction endonuclease McrBC GTP-binding regulatory subunit McrB